MHSTPPLLPLCVCQATLAVEAITAARTLGHWVLLNNVHLMPEWLPALVKLLDSLNALPSLPHINFRLIMSSEPSDLVRCTCCVCVVLTACWPGPACCCRGMERLEPRCDLRL